MTRERLTRRRTPPEARTSSKSDSTPRRPPGISTDSILRVFRVPPECEGMRLDRFLPLQLRATSRTRAKAIIENCAYSWDGRPLRASERVRAEDRVALWRPAFDEGDEPEDLVVLYEDPHLLVIDKPPLMTVHPTARHHRYTVIKRLELQYPDQYLSLIHRLDRETSGVLLVARSPDADSQFKTALERRSIAAARAAENGDPVEPADKIYLAITWGIPPEGLIDAPLEADPSPLRVKMRVADSARSDSSLAARTSVEVTETRGDYALVRCQLHTGRQHQIRVHLAHVGTPIVGDKLYGPDDALLARAADSALTADDLELLELPRHALHAHEYRVDHCFTREELRIRSELPDDLRTFWESRT